MVSTPMLIPRSLLPAPYDFVLFTQLQLLFTHLFTHSSIYLAIAANPVIGTE